MPEPELVLVQVCSASLSCIPSYQHAQHQCSGVETFVPYSD